MQTRGEIHSAKDNSGNDKRTLEEKLDKVKMDIKEAMVNLPTHGKELCSFQRLLRQRATLEEAIGMEPSLAVPLLVHT